MSAGHRPKAAQDIMHVAGGRQGGGLKNQSRLDFSSRRALSLSNHNFFLLPLPFRSHVFKSQDLQSGTAKITGKRDRLDPGEALELPSWRSDLKPKTPPLGAISCSSPWLVFPPPVWNTVQIFPLSASPTLFLKASS